MRPGILTNHLSMTRSNVAQTLAVRVGIAFAAANLWKVRVCHEPATELIVRLSANAKGHLAVAIMRLFQVTDNLYEDDSTRRILDAIALNPDLLKATNDNYLVEKLEDLVTAEREGVYRICRR